jgi:hypothetical protein
MQDTITTIYCVCDEVLNALGHQDDSQSRMSSAEIMLVPIVAALYYRSNHALTRQFLFQHRYLKSSLCASRFGRRLRLIPESAWQMVFRLLAQLFVQANKSGYYAVDSMPVLVCQNARINRCRLFRVDEHEALRGKQASKKRFFYGFKIHLLVTRRGEPIEFFISEGSMHDLEGLRRLDLDLPKGSHLFADKAYISKPEEKLLQEAAQIRLISPKRANAKTPLSQELLFLCQSIRHNIETAFGEINKAMPTKIHAVSQKGFLLKVNALIIAYAFACAMK